MNDFEETTTEDLIDCLPENYPLYKDSGLWQLRTDCMESVIFEQDCNESLRQFIIKCLDGFLNKKEFNMPILVDLSIKNTKRQQQLYLAKNN